MMIYGWDNPYMLIGEEIKQLQFEGRVVPKEILEEYNNLDRVKDIYNERVLEGLFLKLLDSEHFEIVKGWNYYQPNNLEEIKKSRPKANITKQEPLDKSVILDKLHGAWIGRASGCALGKPVEIMGMEENGRKNIKEHLFRRDAWPLNNYIEGTPITGDRKALICPQSWRENISYMEPDDDIHYSLIGLKVLETYGKDFTWRNVADTWNSSLPFQAICTAETQAILNYNMKTHWLDRSNCPISPDFTSRYNNPYREWIGAQIRADGWAYCCAGNPELAADFAYRDAHWTHRANGIYGEMFIAAIIAGAFVESDPIRLINIGLSKIPQKSILAEALLEALKWFDLELEWEGFMDRLDEKYDNLSSVHTINNVLICCMALYYSNMEPERAISIAVMAGLDTDCNGATVGSIVGANSGSLGFPNYGSQLHDTIKPLVFGFQEISMKDLANRCFKVWESIK